MKKPIGFGKNNLYLGLVFLVVVGLLSLFIFSGAREGFYGYVDAKTVYTITNSSPKKGICDGGKSGVNCK